MIDFLDDADKYMCVAGLPLHSGEWPVLWAYGGGQKTQLSCFWYNMLVSFMMYYVVVVEWCERMTPGL